MVDELTIPTTRGDTSQPPRVSLSTSSEDGAPERTRHSNHAYASSDVTAAPSQAEDRETTFAKRSVKDISDTSSQSPWSKKYLLALDGGGIRGYTSLLILKELLCLIATLEKGESVAYPDGSTSQKFSSCSGSGDCPWYSTPSHFNSQPLDAAQSNSSTPGSNETNARSPDPAVNLSKFRIHHYFDYVAGTSTGGLSAIMLSRMQMDIDRALAQYTVVGNDVFGKPRFGYKNPKFAKLVGLLRPKYATKKMESALNRVLRNGPVDERLRTKIRSEDIVLENFNKYACHTALVARGGHLIQGPYLFRSYDHPRPGPHARSQHLNPEPAHRVELCKVARATSAAPLYFDKIVIKGSDFKDGGLGDNNPAAIAADDISQIHGGRYPRLIISIGTGKVSDEQLVTDPDLVKKSKISHGLLKYLKDNFGLLETLENIATDSERKHRDLERHIKALRCAHPKYPLYFRFNVPDITSIDLDEWKPSKGGRDTLKRLEDATRTYLARPDVQRDLLQCATELVDLRRKRAETERWERFATDFIYWCPFGAECETALELASRDELRQHAFDGHEYVTWPHHSARRCCSAQDCDHIPEGDSDNEREEALLRHLRDDHEMKLPQLKTLHEMESWLDKGRTTIGKVLEKRRTGFSQNEVPVNVA